MFKFLRKLFDRAFSTHSPSKTMIVKGKYVRKLLYDYYNDEEVYKWVKEDMGY